MRDWVLWVAIGSNALTVAVTTASYLLDRRLTKVRARYLEEHRRIAAEQREIRNAIARHVGALLGTAERSLDA